MHVLNILLKCLQFLTRVNTELNTFVCWRRLIKECFVNSDSFKKTVGSTSTYFY